MHGREWRAHQNLMSAEPVWERAERYRRMMQENGYCSIRALARATGDDHSRIARLLNVLKLPDGVLTALSCSLRLVLLVSGLVQGILLQPNVPRVGECGEFRTLRREVIMRTSLGCLFVLLVGTPTMVTARAQGDAVSVDPTHHHVILENDHVRVFEVMAAPGARSAMHTHPPTAVISLGAARAKMTMGDGTTGLFDLHPGQVFWVESAEHGWEVVSGNVHGIGVEVKAARQGRAPAAAPLGPRDAVAVDPTHHNVILENDHVRVLEGMASPGARSAMHTHPPLVVVSLGTTRARMTAPDGTSMIFDLHPGQVFWSENSEHGWEILAGQVHVIAVEVKAARQAAARR